MSDAGQRAGAGLIRYARQKAGLTQSELAARAGVPRETVSAYERSLRQPTLPTLSRVLKAAGYELRLHLEPYDDHDDVLAALEQQRSKLDQERWDTYQTARVARDRATTAAALRSRTGRHARGDRRGVRPMAIVDAFNRHQVDDVVIGGFAAELHEAAVRPTRDIDFTPSATLDNLERVSRALTDRGARFRTDAVPYMTCTQRPTASPTSD